MLNKEVKVILDLVRMKGNAARSKIVSIVITTLISGLLVSIPVPANAAACNPTITTATNGDKVLSFTNIGSCDWTVPAGIQSVWVVAVGGGGASGAGVSNQWWGAGGGGGQVASENVSVTAGNTITITVGAGGNAGDGGSSTFGVVSAAGGKAPINTDRRGGVSGSNQVGGLSGLTGTASGGGGGALGAGSGMNAGAGVSSSITDTAIEYGGGGTGYNGSASGTQRVGAGKYNTAPTANRGGGASQMATARGIGASGVVIVRHVASCSPTTTTTDSDYVLTFKTTGQCGWSVPAGLTSVDLLVVGAGGGGGSSLGGGGGGGQVVAQSSVTLDVSATISVGAGGAGGNGSYTSSTNHGRKGSNSSFVSGSTSHIAIGGSGGNGRMSATNLNADGTAISTGYTGGGGAYPNGNSGIAIAGVGGNSYKGGNGTGSGGGGGGGAGGTGVARDASSNASSGGVGISSDISGVTTFYGGGGGATWYGNKTNWTGAGGNGGGGQGADGNVVGGAGVANTGGGGGGAYDGLTGGNGGSGVVIIRYARAPSTISYNANGGNASAPSSQSQSAAGDLLTLATYSGTKNSMRFMNWNTAADGSGVNYAAGEAVRPFSNITLYAQWMGAYCPEGWTWTEPVCNKSYTGQQNFIIPWGFNSLDVIVLGGSGANGARGVGGAPGKVHASYAFTQGDNIRFYPGAAGSGVNGGLDSWPHENYNGGTGLTNNGGSGGGGAASVITKNGTATGNVIIVAGGGGGGGANNACYSQWNPISSTPGNPAASSNGLTYGTNGGSHGYNMFSGAGGGGTNGGKNGGSTAAYSCSSGNDNGGLGLGGYRGGNTISGAAATVLNGANTSGGVAGSVTLQLTRPKITYNLNGGTGTTPANQVQTSEGEDLTITNTTPERTGYTFGGWNTLAAGTGTNYSANAIYNTNAVLNLYAKWTANNYNVIYDTSTVTSGTMANTALTAGTAFTLRTNAFAKVGHTFKNWNTAANGSGTTYTNNQSVTLFSDLTLYPQWNLIAPGAPTVTTEAGNTEVTVTPTAAAASGTTVGPTTSMLVRTYNSSGVALNPAKTCAVVSPATSCVITGLTNGTTYQFDATATNATATSAGSTKVNGIPAGVAVTYNATSNGGSTGTASATYGKPTALVLPSASKDGFTFSGWYTAATGGTLIGGAGGNYSPNVSASIVNRSLTSNVATLTTSSPHGLVVGMSVIVINVNATFNGTYTIASVPTTTTFTYAKTATNVTAAAVSPAGKATVSALTLYAQFVGNTYTISYNGNGSTGGTVPSNGSYQAGSTANKQVFDYTGTDQDFTVPGDITGAQQILVEIWGAGGGGTKLYYAPDFGGGAGGYTKATISTPTPGEVLKVRVGKGGSVGTITADTYSGGGAGGNVLTSPGNSGGGYSGVFAGTTPIAISGGGGGASPGHDAEGKAGGGGGANQNGTTSTNTNKSGGAGTTTAGGAAAVNCATAGTQYAGGNGCSNIGHAEGGGGGGGGYYGGGGGDSNGQSNGGGGGGSGYLDATRGTLISATVGELGAANTTWAFPDKTSANYGTTNAGRGGKGNTNTTADSNGGNGRVVIQWNSPSNQNMIQAGPTRVGYTFAGWNTKADGTGDNYAVNDFYATNANVSLFAKWTAAARSVAYALDGGSSSATTTTLTGKVVGNTITLPASNTMSKTGYVFAGWNDGTTTFAGGATWTVPASDNNFTLTAQWTTQTLSYSYDTNGGGTAPASGTKTYGQSLVLEASTGLSKTGYTFAGWNDGSTTHLAGATITINASKVFVAQWSAQSYSITYNGNGSNSGSVTAGSYVAGGVPYAIAANGFTKTGYTFAGWKDASNNSFTVGSGYSTAANLVLTAQWTASSYTVTYNGNGSTGGTAPVDGAYTTDVAFSVSSNSGNLVKAGYTFAGWNTSASGHGTSYAENGALTTSSNIILYAKWTIVSPTITFNKGAATVTPTVFPSNTSAQYGSVFTLPTTDTSTVISSVTQIFTGWSDGTNTYAAGDTYRVGIDNITFTAQWIAVYTVRYVLNGGTGTVPADILRTDQFTETLTSASVTKTGFTLTGWKDQSGASITAGANSWLITGTSYVAYAQWSPTQRTLSFNVNGGSDSQASITGKVIGELVTLPTPTSTKTGYTFTGWSNSGTTYPAGGTFVVGNGDAAFVAAWTGNVNIITYNGNGATGGTAPVSGSYVSGESTPYTVSGNTGTLVKSGFTFDNWYTTSTGSGGAAYTAGSGTLTTTSNLILYAKWSAASYAVTYASGDNTITAPTQSNTMYGSSFSLPSALTRNGYTFLGWEIGSGADANVYAPGSSFTMGSSAITFTAKWNPLSFVIVYSLNGGSGDTPTQANVEYNQGFTTAAAPTKSGFTFSGWSDGATTTNASTSISNVTANKTLTAQWTIALPGTPGAPTAAPGNGGATITISAPNTGGAPSSYTVTALDNSGNPLSPSQTCTVVSPGTSCSISPLTNGTAYKFSTTATNAAGTSASGSTASGAVIPASAPSAPLGVAGSGTGASATVTWSAPTENGGSAITDYVVEYRVATSGSWTTFSDGVSTTTSATVTGLTAGSSYEFRVTAKNLIGNSLASFTSPVVETLPSVPTITGVTASSGQVTVAWNAPAHLGSGTLAGDEYTVTAYDAQGNEAGTCKPTSGERSCAVTGLDNGSAYTFRVEAVTTVGTSEKSLTSSSITPSGTPSAPADVVAVTSGSNMTVTFTAPADNGGAAITSYVITSSPVGATCTVGANATTYICSGLTAGANYTFTAKAVNVRGQSSASQPSTAVIAIAAPSAPQNISAVITAGSTTLSATVSFDAPATDNGSAVISYTVTASPGGATCTVTAPDLFCEIPVLPDSIYTFTATATNAVGRSVASVTSLQTAASNGIAPSLVDNPIAAPTGDVIENQVLTSTATYTSTPNSVLSYVWKRCTDQFDDTTCTNISGATSSTYTLTSADVDKFIRVATTATNSIGTSTDLSQTTEAITAAPVVTPAPTPAPSTPSVTPAPSAPSCDEACQAARDAASTKAAADAAAKAAADKLAADAAAKLKADAAATTASTKANADAAAAAAAAKAAVEKAAAAEAAKIAAEAAAASAAAKAKAAADAQTAANKAAATAAAALKNSAASAAAKAAATASAQKAAASAAAAVKAAATAAQQAATAKNSAANANKQVDIAINSLNSKTAASQASAQANAIAAAAKAAANEAAAAAAAKASEAKAAATAAQKAAAETAARIATEQKEAATAAAAAKAAADAAAKATAEKIAATNAAKTASENLLKVLEEKATLAEQAAKTSDENVRAEIAKKLEEIEVKAVEAEKIAEEATAEADDAVAEYEEAIDQATEASEVAETQAAEAVAVKAESVTKTAVATKAAAAATVAAKVATAAKAAAAKVPSKAVITKKPSTTSKNSATATVTGLKPGQKVKVTVNVKPKP